MILQSQGLVKNHRWLWLHIENKDWPQAYWNILLIKSVIFRVIGQTRLQRFYHCARVEWTTFWVISYPRRDANHDDQHTQLMYKAVLRGNIRLLREIQGSKHSPHSGPSLCLSSSWRRCLSTIVATCTLPSIDRPVTGLRCTYMHRLQTYSLRT